MNNLNPFAAPSEVECTFVSEAGFWYRSTLAILGAVHGAWTTALVAFGLIWPVVGGPLAGVLGFGGEFDGLLIAVWPLFAGKSGLLAGAASGLTVCLNRQRLRLISIGAGCIPALMIMGGSLLRRELALGMFVFALLLVISVVIAEIPIRYLVSLSDRERVRRLEAGTWSRRQENEIAVVRLHRLSIVFLVGAAIVFVVSWRAGGFTMAILSGCVAWFFSVVGLVFTVMLIAAYPSRRRVACVFLLLQLLAFSAFIAAGVTLYQWYGGDAAVFSQRDRRLRLTMPALVPLQCDPNAKIFTG